jgi:rare lipoprotein A
MKVLLIFFLFVLSISCSGSKPPETPDEGASGDEEKQVYIGLASYYAGESNGQMTANGSPYGPNELTAAHRNLPLGTKVLVTNLENNRSVVVTITDRGPSRADRIIDLSLAAAQELGMLSSGVAKVRIEVVNE